MKRSTKFESPKKMRIGVNESKKRIADGHLQTLCVRKTGHSVADRNLMKQKETEERKRGPALLIVNKVTPALSASSVTCSQ